MPTAIVAIVAMFLATLLWAGKPQGLTDNQSSPYGARPEVILYIDPPRKQIVYVTPPSLPERNPHR